MRKCDECQEPLETTHKGDMYAHPPCNDCKWGMFGVIPNLPDHFRPKKEFDCDGCIHFEKKWGACEYQWDDEVTKEYDLFKPKYKGKECPKFTEKGEFDCYAYPGVSVKVTEEDCKKCEMGLKGCPAYNPEWLKKESGEIWVVTPNLGALRVR